MATISCAIFDDSGDNNELQHRQVNTDWLSLEDSPWPMYNHDPQNTGRSEYTGPGEDAAILLEWTPNLQLQTSIALGHDDGIFLNTCLDSGGIHIKKINMNGNVIWNTIVGDDSYSYTTPTISTNSILYTSSNDGTIWAISTTDGSLLWETYINDYIYSMSIVLDQEGNLYFPSWKHLNSINSQGTLRWSVPIEDLNQVGAISPDGLVLYYGSQSILYAISTTDGSIINSFRARSVLAPTVSNEGNLFFQNGFDTSIVCLSPDFNVIWRYYVGREGGNNVSTESGTLDYEGNYYTTASGKLWSLTFEGALRWQIDLPDFGQSTALICDSENNIYVLGYITSGAGGSKIISYTSNGELRWEIMSTFTSFYEVPAITSGGQLVVPVIGSRTRTLLIIG